MLLKNNKQFFVSIKKISAFLFAFLLVLISTFQISAASYETDGFVYSVSDGNASVTGYKKVIRPILFFRLSFKAGLYRKFLILPLWERPQ